MARQIGKGEILRVWRSYLAGSRTTGEVAAHTGFTVKKASAYTTALIERGRIRRTGIAPNQEGRRGNKFRWYEPVLSRSRHA